MQFSDKTIKDIARKLVKNNGFFAHPEKNFRTLPCVVRKLRFEGKKSKCR